ncbi:MAG: hypothetical protein ISN28_02230 [Ectothiorhodospiraceae bacterium AqS1]|nr:hypothetical protein [Ectothiorhodospiraceae bacterium AqS1]
MAESDEHRLLVGIMMKNLKSLYQHKSASITADIDSYARPPNIGNFRPDIFINIRQDNKIIICEAKTWPDLKSQRSEKQILSFLTYLESAPKCGCFILGGFGHFMSEYGKSMLRNLRLKHGISACSLQVFDGLDCWQMGDKSWHLI